MMPPAAQHNTGEGSRWEGGEAWSVCTHEEDGWVARLSTTRMVGQHNREVVRRAVAATGGARRLGACKRGVKARMDHWEGEDAEVGRNHDGTH